MRLGPLTSLLENSPSAASRSSMADDLTGVLPSVSDPRYKRDVENVRASCGDDLEKVAEMLLTRQSRHREATRSLKSTEDMLEKLKRSAEAAEIELLAVEDYIQELIRKRRTGGTP
jgi:hypothetical protein